MNDIGKPERANQPRVIGLLRDELGYCFLGGWTDRDGSRPNLIRINHFRQERADKYGRYIGKPPEFALCLPFAIADDVFQI